MFFIRFRLPCDPPSQVVIRGIIQYFIIKVVNYGNRE